MKMDKIEAIGEMIRDCGGWKHIEYIELHKDISFWYYQPLELFTAQWREGENIVHVENGKTLYELLDNIMANATIGVNEDGDVIATNEDGTYYIEEIFGIAEDTSFNVPDVYFPADFYADLEVGR